MTTTERQDSGDYNYARHLDLGILPQPTEKDAMWAWRLWNTLQIPSSHLDDDGEIRLGGIWDMPGVGRFIRTDVTQMTLTEIHAELDDDDMGVSVWNKRDWIVLLGQGIGWDVVTDRVLKADNEVLTPAAEPPLQHIGKIHVCPCGMIYSLLPSGSSDLRIKLNEDGDCLNPNCDIVVPLPWASYMCVINDSAVIAKQEAQEQMDIAWEEEEGEYSLKNEIPVPDVSDEMPMVQAKDEEE
tara:strand:+ start:13621 stop:14340 length:720 start_codon:yes stop_codon:yes gene_type:complete